MVQVLPANPRKQLFAQRLGETLGEALSAGAQIYGQHQRQKQREEALKGVESVYNDPNLSEQQKLIKSYQLLGKFPELTQQLTGPLSRLGGQQESFRNKIIGQQQEQNRLAQSFQTIQNLYNDPNLSEEQKIFGLYQELNQNPTLASHLLGSLQKPGKERGEDVAGQQFSSGYNAILEGDNETLKDVLEDPTTPLPVKRKLTDLRDKFETRKGTKSRELSRRQSFVQNAYKQTIDNEKRKLKTAPQSEHREIAQSIKRLQDLQKKDLGKLTKNPDDYADLALWNMLPESEGNDQFEKSQFGQPEREAQEKIQFDSRNPEHIARAKQVLAEVGGDKAKANAILAEEFSK